MTEAEANAVYDVLVRECGAKEGRQVHGYGRGAFVRHVTSEYPSTEWYFGGTPDFGGKLYLGRHGEPPRVGCYREDDTPERRAMVERANAALAEMVKR